MAMRTHVAAPAKTNSQGLRTGKPVREELSVICACTGPVGTGLGAVKKTKQNKKSSAVDKRGRKKC